MRRSRDSGTIVASYEPRTGLTRLGIAVLGMTLGGIASWLLIDKDGAPGTGVALAAFLAGSTLLAAWYFWALHRGAGGRGVILDRGARTLTFIRPPGFWPSIPGKDRVVSFDDVHDVRQISDREGTRLVVRGRDVHGRRVSLRIDDSMDRYRELWLAMQELFGERAHRPWWNTVSGALALLVGVLAVFLGVVLAIEALVTRV